MFERFTDQARAAVLGAREHARRLGHDHVDAGHLLLAVCSDDGEVGERLRGLGLAPAAVESALRRQAPAQAALDREALALIGIDLDVVRERIEAVFGPSALTPPPAPRRRRGRRGRRSGDPCEGGYLRFGADAKKALELALREALAARAGHIGLEHLAAGLTRIGDGPVPRVLAATGVRPSALRAAVLPRHRKAG